MTVKFPKLEPGKLYLMGPAELRSLREAGVQSRQREQDARLNPIRRMTERLRRIVEPIVVTTKGEVIFGHHRRKVSIEQGVECPVYVYPGPESVEELYLIELGSRDPHRAEDKLHAWASGSTSAARAKALESLQLTSAPICAALRWMIQCVGEKRTVELIRDEASTSCYSRSKSLDKVRRLLAARLDKQMSSAAVDCQVEWFCSGNTRSNLAAKTIRNWIALLSTGSTRDKDLLQLKREYDRLVSAISRGGDWP